MSKEASKQYSQLTIHRVANGFIVLPGQAYDGMMRPHGSDYVYEKPSDLAWFIERWGQEFEKNEAKDNCKCSK